MVSNTGNGNGNGDKIGLTRSRYFPRQTVTAADLTADQTYFQTLWRFYNRTLHGCGVVCGLEVLPAADERQVVVVTRGYALSPQGDGIFVPGQQTVTIKPPRDPTDDCLNLDPQSEIQSETQVVYLAIRYAEKLLRPLPLLPERCAPASTCEYSRIQASFELACLDECPQTCQRPAVNCQQVYDEILAGQRQPPIDTDSISALFACPPETPDPWVVLAGITLDPAAGLQVDYSVRSQLLPTRFLTQILRCLSGAAPPPTPYDRFYISQPQEQLFVERAEPEIAQRQPESSGEGTVSNELPLKIEGIRQTESGKETGTNLSNLNTVGNLATGNLAIGNLATERSPEEVDGIGPVYASRLKSGGVDNLNQLAAMEASSVAQILEISETRASDFVERAKGLLSQVDKE